MTPAIAERDVPSIPKEELDLVRRTVANGATDAELKLFLFDCQRRGVHPLDKLLHFTKRGGKYTPVTSIDFMRSQAARTGEMAGSDDPVFHPKPTGAEPGKFLPPSAATVTVYRMTQGQRFGYTATARWAEYCPDNAPMWKRMPHTMLSKCAEALALRKAFPQQLAGLYSREEMDQADAAPSARLSDTEARGIGPLTQSGGDSEGRPSGAELLEGAAPPSDSNIDRETGEERPVPPTGYFYIGTYTFRSGWHELTLLHYDAQGGSFKLETKKNIGYIAGEAFSEGIPVKVSYSHKQNSRGEGYLETIEKYAPPVTVPPAMLDVKDLPF